MSVSPFDLAEIQKQPGGVLVEYALGMPSPEFVQPKYPLLANALTPGGNNVSPAELANAVTAKFPGTTVESVGLDDISYAYQCNTRTVGIAIDPSGEAYAPVHERRMQRSVSVGDRGITEVTSRDIDPAPGRTIRPGKVVFEPHEDPDTHETLFTDDNGNHYTRPGKMHTCMEDLDGNWVIGHTLERVYTKNPDGTYAAEPDTKESFFGDNQNTRSRMLELYALANPLFPGEASPEDVLKAIEKIRQMASPDAIKARGNLGDLYVDDLPNGSTAVGFQYARNGSIVMYQYVVDQDGYTTHYSYGRNRIFASPAEQEHDEAVEWWVETTFGYGIVAGHKRMTRLHWETKTEIKYGVAGNETRDETYTHTPVKLTDGGVETGEAYVVANVERDKMRAGETKPEHTSFDFQRDVIEPLELDTSEGNPINMVQTQAVREERADGSVEKYEGEEFRRVFHYGFVSTEDLSIPLVVVRTPDGSLACEIDRSEDIVLVPARK